MSPPLLLVDLVEEDLDCFGAVVWGCGDCPGGVVDVDGVGELTRDDGGLTFYAGGNGGFGEGDGEVAGLEGGGDGEAEG